MLRCVPPASVSLLCYTLTWKSWGEPEVRVGRIGMLYYIAVMSMIGGVLDAS